MLYSLSKLSYSNAFYLCQIFNNELLFFTISPILPPANRVTKLIQCVGIMTN